MCCKGSKCISPQREGLKRMPSVSRHPGPLALWTYLVLTLTAY